MPRLLFLCSLFLLYGTCVRAQQPTSAADRLAGYERRLSLQEGSPLTGLPFTNIGPSIMSGRVTDVAVDPADPTHFYVAYASGGLWETTDNGSTFSPLFQQEAVMTIGDIDVHWPSGTIYIGTGEVNSSRSSYAGNGVYRSTDKGKSWSHLGLDESHHIGRVIVDQSNQNRLWVAALGHLYGPNPERGVYLTTDGGKSWQKTLFINDSTGVVDLVRDPRKPNQLFAAAWQRERKAWDFTESGPGSGIYASPDAGKTWSLITREGQGFPTGQGVGRIGLAVSYDSRGRRHLYASLDNYFLREAEAPDSTELTKNQLRNMPREDLLRLETYLLEDFLRSNGFPRDLDAKTVRERVEKGDLSPLQLVQYLEDANSTLFDTPVKGFELYHTTNDGKKWERTHEDYLDDVYYSYGYYFGALAVHPEDPQTIYAMGVPIIKSTDGGKTWAGANGDNVHADHHFMWINPAQPNHLINGNDGGVNISYNGGKSWFKANVPPVGQYYAVAVDNHPDGYRVYGGLQDNGTWRGPHDYEASTDWQQDGKYPYEALFGGDGMQVEVDPRDNETAYVGFQFGNYYRINPKEGTRTFITPKHELGQRPFRWNWQTPILISPHQPDIFYMGSNHFHRSFDRGDNFQTLGPDLTRGGRAGDVAFGTLTTIDESPLRFGLLYVGSDDGLVHRSMDGGQTWQPLQGFADSLWVARLDASHADEKVVYLGLNGYRDDNFESYVYRSTDYGDTWTRIGTDLPAEPVNVIKEDPLNPALLYVGTDHGLYVSLDTGRTFTAAPNLPAVAVHDVVVQEQAKDLIVGTHGRSLYRGNVSLLQQVAGKSTPALSIAAVEDQRYSSRYGSASWFTDDTTPEVTLQVYSPSADAGATLTVKSEDGVVLTRKPIRLTQGFNTVPYDLSFDADKAADLEALLNKDRKDNEKPARVEAADNGTFYLRPGKYTLVVEADGNSTEATLTVK
ncbi:WD40/YVTN/BNR-like repeat-containing protein [Neolewinella litorea]|uniref:Glycosyl hydrolase n=1 Tax=Neolewinella litorea TaxID=2562452 RepID=A0A4S4NP80_9BACT|nr:glycosyl hydrolase [Neolewinella litorea]THH41702.1 glycosyl hydrolase [Neolewinella litorea]